MFTKLSFYNVSKRDNFRNNLQHLKRDTREFKEG